ncbi:MAG: hypothetical protein COW02_07455 [Comamonadaceae bacterium CG12_big_fil_rev_8_21_14_0_65_59_15]|nr:MAG: hypothetical protein COW02_07455 [Comamonadaceae bacterium CG12_big_fil_rev_8_21_14_0_65_59_15]
MIHDPHHTISALTVRSPTILTLTFADGLTLAVDLSIAIRSHPSLTALLDPKLFAQARIDARGGYVIWVEDELELAADNLRNMAVEQAGGIGSERILNWMDKHGLTQESAAQAIGVSRRMLNYYLSGVKPIPKTVWLACRGWEAVVETAHA